MTIMRSCAAAGVGLWLLLASATSDAGGIDGGYGMSTSADPGGPVAEWIDISVDGTLVTGLSDDNSAAGTIPLPTDFRYFAQTYSSLKIGSNGWVSFSDTSNIAACFPTIPTAGGPSDAYLAPYMADLNFAGGGNPGQVRTFHDAPENRFIVSYSSVPYWSVSAPGWTGSTNFQVVLDLDSGAIRFNYLSITPPPLNAACNDISVGIEGPGGLGIAYAHDTAVPAPFSIVFTPHRIDVAPTSGLITDEGGAVAVFDVVLSSVPAADVFVPVWSSDPGEGTVAVSGLTFTPANWSTPQPVTVTGADDGIVDGPVPYSIVLGAATSADPNYNALDPADVALTNEDDDSAGVMTVPPVSAVTTEAGGSTSFTLVLNAQPAADVVIPVASNDTTEGTLSAASVTFSSVDWNIPQSVIVTGVDDVEVDGDVGFAVVTGLVSSADPVFDGQDPADVALTNLDDDSASVTISDADAGTVEGTGVDSQVTFSVTLDTDVAGGFTVPYATADGSATAPADYGIAAGDLVFVGTAGEVQTLQVTVVGDAVSEPSESFVVNLGTPSNPAVALAISQGIGTITDDDAADLSLSLSDGPDPIAGGSHLSYGIVVSNAGPGDATAVVVTLAVSDGTGFVSGTVAGGGSCAGSPVLCALDGTLVPGSTRAVTIVVAVHPSVASGTTIDASASVSSAVVDPNPANNDAGTTTTTIPAAVFADGFEDATAALQIELGDNGPKSVAVPLLDALATAAPHRVVTAAVILQHGERIGLVQVRCEARICEARVLRLGPTGLRHADIWTRVEEDPLPLRLTVARRALTDVQYGN